MADEKSVAPVEPHPLVVSQGNQPLSAAPKMTQAPGLGYPGRPDSQPPQELLDVAGCETFRGRRNGTSG